MISIRIKHLASHTAVYLQALVLALPILLGTMPFAYADELSNRSISISSSVPGAAVEHTATFDIPTTTNIGSIVFEYCTSPLNEVVCVPPTGLDLTSSNLVSQTGNTGFSKSIPDSTANRLVITRPATPGVVTQSSYRFNNIINPTNSAETSFVRIFTHTTTDGTGAFTDNGSVAFATADVFQVEAYVPPFLTFCVGVFVTINCNSTTGNRIDVGELQEDLTATGSLQFSGGTNDFTGFTTYLNGSTMTSGNNVISALASNSGSVPGTSQFGLNVRANSNPSAGLDPVGAGASVPNSGYNIPNSFRFVNGEAITSSSTSTDFRLFTATYIVNVSPSQPPGVYATTMTFTAVAAF